MDTDKVQRELNQIAMRLQKDGLSPEASVEERLINSEEKLQTLRTQQDTEKEEMQSYTEHIQGLLETREGVIADYEVMQQELHQIRQQQERQKLELTEMLTQEGLEELALRSPSEQVAFFLLERAKLIERVVVAENVLERQNRPENLDQSQDFVLSQTSEEAKQIKQDLHKAQCRFTSAERELLYEKERCSELNNHNMLLEQENIKLTAELKQVQSKLAQVEKNLRSQEAEFAHEQQKIRELEMELARNAMNRGTTVKLQEDLQEERAKIIASNKKVVELQQQLSSVQRQLRVEEARNNESVRLEMDNRDLSETLSALRAKQQEESISRKLLQQREIELKQQIQSLKQNEAAQTKRNAGLNQHAQKLEARLAIMETEVNNAQEKMRERKKSNQRLQEDLVFCQKECKTKGDELQHVLQQLDTHIRKYNERKSQDKTKQHKTKQLLIQKMAQKDDVIQKLEKDLNLASSLSHKDKERIKSMTEENGKLLKEKRELMKMRQMKGLKA